MAEPLVLVEASRPGIVKLTLNRPAKRNALCAALLQQLVECIRAAEANPSHRVLMLGAAGPAFCAGLDLAEAQDPARAEESAHWIAAALEALAMSRLISVAVVQGPAIAGGAGIVSACDFVVAAETAVFGYPEVHRGLVPGLVMTFLRRQLRERDVRELILLGEVFDARRALAMGFVNRIVPAAEVGAAAMHFAEQLLLGAPGAVAATKALLADLWPNTVVEHLHHAHSRHMAARNSAEAAEGLRAFHEKRTPNWQISES